MVAGKMGMVMESCIYALLKQINFHIIWQVLRIILLTFHIGLQSEIKTQWGYKNENFSSANQTFTFPVAFNTVYAVALGGGNSNSYTTNNWEASGQLKVYNVSITKLVIQYSGPKYFIAIGE